MNEKWPMSFLELCQSLERKSRFLPLLSFLKFLFTLFNIILEWKIEIPIVECIMSHDIVSLVHVTYAWKLLGERWGYMGEISIDVYICMYERCWVLGLTIKL